MTNIDSEEYRKNIERKVLSTMEERLLSGQMNADRAKEIAEYILDTLRPNMTLDNIYKAVLSFDEHFSELIPVMLPVTNEYEEKIKNIVTVQVSKLVQEKRFDEANKLLKKAVNKEISITQ